MSGFRSALYLTRIKPFNSLRCFGPARIIRPGPARSFSNSIPRRESRRYVRFEEGEKHSHNLTKWNAQQLLLLGLGLGGATYYVTHLERVPETGRWRFMDVSPKLETSLAAAAREQNIAAFGPKALPANHPLTKHVRKVVSRILEANNLGHLKSSGRPAIARSSDDIFDPDAGFGSARTEDTQPGLGGQEWELMVVNDDSVINAMTAYGDIIVFTGILPVAKDEDGLAAILGHEIAHVVARHSSEKVSSTKILLAIASILVIVGLDFGISNWISTLLYELPNGRTQEYEADQIGLKLAARACYDPKASPEMFSRLAHLEKKINGGVPEFLATHPASSKRVERLQSLLPEAYQIQAESPECSRLKDSIMSFQDAFNNVFRQDESPVTVWRYA